MASRIASMSPDDTQLFLSCPPDDSVVQHKPSARLSDIFTWTKEHLHLQLNLPKTKLLVIPENPTHQQQLNSQQSIEGCESLGVTRLYSIRTIGPYLTHFDTQLHAPGMFISHFDCCNAFLAGSPTFAP